jgi:RNase adapter protein RapZ
VHRQGGRVKTHLNLVVVTGLSGSGKSTAIHVLEDLGFYCVDNLPVALIPRFLEICESSGEELNRVALGIDLRERTRLGDLPRVLDELKGDGHRVDVLFLDAGDEMLMRRFSETRRPHPLAATGTPADGIRLEREKLAPLRERADRIIDTTALTVHGLREELHRLVAGVEHAGVMTVTLISFGYKYGVPTEGDTVIDVRFLPNPFFVQELRMKSGLDQSVADYVLRGPETGEFLERLKALLEFTLPRYQREGKSYVTVALGCTGGRHRSVVLVEELRSVLVGTHYRVLVRHRDIER